jgi:hypothetical protein
MSGLTLNKYINSTIESSKRETGDKAYPIWLIVNPKHPAVRHNIWTPVLSEMQEFVFRKAHVRIDTTNLYIRNVVSNSEIVPNTLNWWGTEVAAEIELFRQIASDYQPKILITFGAFPFEFVRRAYSLKPEKGPKFWGTANLGDEFVKAIDNFDIEITNRFPLLRRVIESGKFIEDEDNYSRNDVENYFHYVGTKIAEKLLEYKEHLNIWIE